MQQEQQDVQQEQQDVMGSTNMGRRLTQNHPERGHKMYQSEFQSLGVGVLDVVVAVVDAVRMNAEAYVTCPGAYHADVVAVQAPVGELDIAVAGKGPAAVGRQQRRVHERTLPSYLCSVSQMVGPCVEGVADVVARVQRIVSVVVGIQCNQD